MLVVLDTVVFVRGFIKPENVCGKIIFLQGNKYNLVVSKLVVTELLEVLNRTELKKKFSSFAHIDYRRILDFISRAYVVEFEEIPPISRDTKDNKFLATAIAGHADYLVTEDKDLLVLNEYQGVNILTCQAFAEIIKF